MPFRPRRRSVIAAAACLLSLIGSTALIPATADAAVTKQAVGASTPTSFEIKGTGLDIKAHVCAMRDILPLDPPGDQMHTVCWVKAPLGVAPASPSKGTSYIAGHSWAEAPLVLTKMSERVMNQVNLKKPAHEYGIPIYPATDLNGDKITLHTHKGVLTYVVTRAYAVNKSLAGDVPSLMARTPNRLVLLTCGVHDGRDINVNIVVYATLYSSRRT